MSTLKDKSITSTYDQLVKRADTYDANGTRIELMDDSGTAVNTALYLGANGKIGINKTNPVAQIDVNLGDNNSMFLRAADDSLSIVLTTDASGNGGIGLYDAAGVVKSVIAGKVGDPSYILAGNLGVGTATPDDLLHIAGTGGSYLRVENTQSSITDGSSYGGIAWEGQDAGSNASGIRARIDAYAEGAEGGVGLNFITATSNSTALPVRMTINKDGKVGIGVSGPTEVLDVSGNGKFSGTLACGAITSTGSSSFGATSFGDNNITNVGNIALDTISSDAGTSIGVTLGTDSGDDFNVGGGKLVVEGDTGNVGIGNAAPLYDLHIKGGAADDSSSGGGQLALQGTDETVIAGDDLGSIYFLGNDSQSASQVGAVIRANATNNGFDNSDADDAPTALKFFINNSTGTHAVDDFALLTLVGETDSVGIGTTTPEEELQVNNLDAFSCISVKRTETGSTSFSNNNSIAGIYFGGKDQNHDAYSVSNIIVRADSDWDGSNKGSKMMFFNTTGTTNGEKLTIDKSGHTTPGANNAQALGSDAYEWSEVWATDQSVNTSDERLKENIKDLSVTALDKLNALKPRTFDWKKYKSNDGDLTDKGSRVGFIAQEVKSVISELVVEGTGATDFVDKDGNKLISKGEKSLGVSMGGSTMTAYLVKAIQELSAKVTALEKK